MKYYFLCFVTFFALSCASKKALLLDGVKRTYHLYLPKEYDASKKYPVLYLFHGDGSSGWQMNFYTKLSETADKNHFILVVPNGVDKSWRYYDKTDRDYIKKLIQLVENKYSVDKNRCYFVGMSGGGVFCYIMAHEIPKKITAMAVIAANMFNHKFIKTTHKRTPNIPLFLIEGTDDWFYDGIKANDGSPYYLSAKKTLEYWLGNPKNKVNYTENYLPNHNTKDKSKVVKIDYRPSYSLLFYKIEDGGHHWPNARFNADCFTNRKLGNFNKDFNTNQVIWDFLSAY